MKLKKGDSVALVCCSDARNEGERNNIEALTELLTSFGLRVYVDGGMFDASRNRDAKARADSLADLIENPDIAAIFDISGGNLSNGLLAYLEASGIVGGGFSKSSGRAHGRSQSLKESNIQETHGCKPVFGYSDLTTLLNPLCDAGFPAYLYQARNVTWEKGTQNAKLFRDFIFGADSGLASFSARFVRGGEMRGRAVGGNLRSLLKLAGTAYWPDFADKLLFLESLGGDEAFIETCFAQLSQTGALGVVSGVVLGTFTTLEKEGGNAADIALRWLPGGKPIAVTKELGHGADAHALALGAVYSGTAERGLLAPENSRG